MVSRKGLPDFKVARARRAVESGARACAAFQERMKTERNLLKMSLRKLLTVSALACGLAAAAACGGTGEAPRDAKTANNANDNVSEHSL